MNSAVALTMDAAVEPFRCVKLGTTDYSGAVAVDAAAPILGVTSLSAAAGASVAVLTAGLVRVTAGGTVTRGALVTATTDGKVVNAAPATGANAYVVGVALASGVANDEVQIQLTQGVMQGA